MPEEDIFDLEAAVKTLCGRFEQITTVYLFGFRRFNTGSSRSDIDILLICDQRIREANLREFTLEFRSALDLFILEDGRAKSIANESFIRAESNEALIKEVKALLLYERGSSPSQELQRWKRLEVDKGTVHELTTLPNRSTEHYEIRALKKYFRTAREHGLPTKPYLGTSTEEACDFVVEIIRRLVSAGKHLRSTRAKESWTQQIASEAELQDLFSMVAKPWLPALGREQVAVVYDGKEKRSDFSLFNSQLIIEFKHIKDDGDIRETAKTLAGLREFYLQHPNVRVLLFAVLVDASVKLDDRKWEADYSYLDHMPQVRTVVFRNQAAAI